MWIHESAFTSGSEAKPVTRGRPQVYSDALIQALLTLKHVYYLTLRAAKGFVQSLRELAFADLPVPDYTTLSCCAQQLQGNVARDVERRTDLSRCREYGREALRRRRMEGAQACLL